MNAKKHDKINAKVEKALHDSYRADVAMDKTFKKNLDKLIDNSIQAQKLQDQADALKQTKKPRNKGYFSLLFRSFKLQGAFLGSFLVLLIFGGIAFASVPQLREIIKPTSGTLTVQTQVEGAEVFLEGGDYSTQTSIGITPLEKKLKAGQFTMVIRLDSYEDYKTNFTLEAGKSANFDIALKKEDQVIERITEWKTYKDVQEGIEFTYPLSWEFKKQDYHSTSEDDSIAYSSYFLTGNKSELLIYKHHSVIDDFESEEFSIDENTYLGFRDYKEWSYVSKDTITSEQGTNSYKIAFFTKKKNEFEIYDFILEGIKVYDVQKDDTQENWTQFKQVEFGFTLKYPQDWIIVEEEKTDYYVEYEVKPFDNDTEPLRIIYAEGYFEEYTSFTTLKDTVTINGIDATHFYDEETDRHLYVLPCRLFIVYSYNEELDDTFSSILNTFTITKEDIWQTVSDYTWGFEISTPSDWTYEMKVDGDFEIEHGSVTNGTEIIRIYNWDDVQDTWDSYHESLLISEATNRVREVRIGESIYARYEEWSFENNNYFLERIIYIKDTLETDPYISIGEKNFVIIIENTIEPVINPESLPESSEQTLLLFDAIVSSLKLASE